MEQQLRINLSTRRGLTASFDGSNGYTVYIDVIKAGEEVRLYLPSGGVRVYTLVIKEVIEFYVQKQQFLLTVDVIEKNEIPNEFFTVSEQTDGCYYASKGWFPTEKEALAVYDKLEAGDVCKVFKWHPASHILHSKKLEE